MGKGKSWRSKPANGNVLGRIASAAKGRVATRTLVKLLSPDKRRQEKARSDLRREDQQLWRDIGDSMRIAKTRGSHPFQLEFANPSRLIQHLLDESDWLKGLFCSTLARVPCSKEAPWGLMLAYDELTMGNVVKTTPNNRKTMSFYMTFTEFEAHLSVEEAWFSPVVLRSTTMKHLQGQWSHVLSLIVEELLFNAAGGLHSSGLVLHIRGREHVIHAQLRFVLSDGDGFAQGFAWKGAGSLKPCPCCWNLLMLSRDPEPPHVRVDATSGFRSATSDGTWGVVDGLLVAKGRCANRTLTKKRFKEAEKQSGFRADPNSFLANKRLRPHYAFPDLVFLDWFHIFLQDGILNVELGAFLTACKEFCIAGTDVTEIVRWCDSRQWCLPSSAEKSSSNVAKTVQDMCHGKTEITIKTGASQLLTVFPILRHYVDMNILPDARISVHRTSLRLAFDMVSAIMECKHKLRTKTSLSESLRGLWPKWFKAHKTAYEDWYVKPKFHWASHLQKQYLECFADMLVLERLNKRARVTGTWTDNTASFERSVVLSVTKRHVQNLKARGEFGKAKLEGKIDDDPFQAFLRCSASMTSACSRTIKKGDVVFCGNCDVLGEVVRCCADERSPEPRHFLEVAEMRRVRNMCYRSDLWKGTGNVLQWSPEDVFHGSAWCQNGVCSGVIVLR